MRSSPDWPAGEEGSSPKNTREKVFDHRLNPGDKHVNCYSHLLITWLESQGENQKDLKVDRGKFLLEIQNLGLCRGRGSAMTDKRMDPWAILRHATRTASQLFPSQALLEYHTQKPRPPSDSQPRPDGTGSLPQSVQNPNCLQKVEVLPAHSESAAADQKRELEQLLWTICYFGSEYFLYNIWAREHGVLYIKQKINKRFQGIPLPHDQFKNPSWQTQVLKNSMSMHWLQL